MTMSATTPASVSPWKTPRGKFLATLAGIAAVLTIGAGLALTGERARTATRFDPEPVLEGFSDKIASAASVTVKTATGEIALKLNADKKWVAASLHDYPVAGERVRTILLGLSNLTAVEKKTAQAKLHEALGLGDPAAKGSGTLISVTDGAGAPLANLITGKQAPGAMEGEDRFYVRRANEDQTYVAKGALPRTVESADWLETAIVDIPRDRIKTVKVTPLEGPAYTISRAKADDANFVVENIPKGRVVLNDTVANPTGAALAGLTLDDVRKDSEIDFSKTAKDVFTTFDGLTVSLEVADKDNAYWLRASASASGEGDKKDEAAKINARVAGWAYKLSEWKGEVLLRNQERMLQSLVPNAPKAEGTPGMPDGAMPEGAMPGGAMPGMPQ